MNTWTTAARIRVGDHINYDGAWREVLTIKHIGPHLRFRIIGGIAIVARGGTELPVMRAVAREVSA